MSVFFSLAIVSLTTVPSRLQKTAAWQFLPVSPPKKIDVVFTTSIFFLPLLLASELAPERLRCPYTDFYSAGVSGMVSMIS